MNAPVLALDDPVLGATTAPSCTRWVERESIFDMFSRGNAGTLAPGSGIGLAFARRVVARHGGTLRVSDAERGGACFTLVLPSRVATDLDPA